MPLMQCVLLRRLVYMQYEVSQLFKKDGLDFCVLQSDKQMDGVKFVVTMQSVHWPDCPAPDSITRVKVYSFFYFFV